MRAIGRDHLKRWQLSGNSAKRVFKLDNRNIRSIRFEEIERESKLAVWAMMCELTVFMEETENV